MFSYYTRATFEAHLKFAYKQYVLYYMIMVVYLLLLSVLSLR